MLYMYFSAAFTKIDDLYNLTYLYSFQGFCDLGIFSFTWVGFAMSYFVREDSEKLFNDGDFYDYMSLAEY